MNNNVKLVAEIIEKIKVIPLNTETTIAELINYNPEEKFIDPLSQGQIFNEVKKFCMKENICVERNRDELGGLAFYYTFKKVESIKNEFKINNNIIFVDEKTKAEYQKYLDEVNEYNRKIANGETPEKDLTAITDKFKQKFVVNHKSNNYDEFKNWVKKNDDGNNIYFTSHSDIIGKIDFCKSYKPSIIKINNEYLNELRNDKFKLKTEIIIDLDNMRVDLDYINRNSEMFKNALEKLFEIKDELLTEVFSQTLFKVIEWWDKDTDENGNVIDIEYIKRCLDSIDVEMSVDDENTYINVYFGIEGLNGEDFLASHILSALIESKNNYKIEFIVV